MNNLKRELIYMFRKITPYKLITFMFLFFFIFLSCSGEKQKDILVKVGDKEITVDEFLNRAELTPRPPYCRFGNEKSKIIVLNTLITEKIFAMEDRTESELLNKPKFQAYMRGRKEQYMREDLFKSIEVNEDELDPREIKEIFTLAGKVYDVTYVNLKIEEATTLLKEMKTYPGIENNLFNSSILDKLPRQTVNFEDQELPSIHYALYEKDWSKGDVVGPVKLDETDYIVLKIDEISNSPALSQTKILERKKQVTESLIKKKTNSRWNQILAKIMKGKELHFVPDVTMKVAELWSKNFVKDGKVMQIAGFADKDYGAFLLDTDQLSEETMFTVNDEAWTVANFEDALASHPLVFRKPEIDASEFIQQFRFAVADLVQDFFITKEAYRQEIDKSKSIQRKAAMWEDAYLAMEHRHNYLTKKRSVEGVSKKARNYHTLIEGYIGDLLKKYKDQIAINTELFKNIELTHTDIITRQLFVPYRETVPWFPILTRNDKLKYGATLN